MLAMLILVDSREQKPYTFDGYRWTVKPLKIGDYSVSGYSKLIAVERKSRMDWCSCLTKAGWPRFIKQLERMSELRCGLLVVESNLWDRNIFGQMPAGARMHRALEIVLNYVPVLFAGNRSGGKSATLAFLKLAKAKVDRWQ